jgi:hypothetical protein
MSGEMQRSGMTSYSSTHTLQSINEKRIKPDCAPVLQPNQAYLALPSCLRPPAHPDRQRQRRESFRRFSILACEA